MRIPFRHYMAVTTVSALFLILLGVYTGKVGAGLACDARWPLCDGGYFGILPATWPSFVEWFHRLVAMVVGFMILGGAFMAFRGDHHRYIKYATGAAVVLLPLQILFGANTVLSFGIWASMLHQAAAQLIFGSLVLGPALAYFGPEPDGEATATPQTSSAPSQADD